MFLHLSVSHSVHRGMSVTVVHCMLGYTHTHTQSNTYHPLGQTHTHPWADTHSCPVHAGIHTPLPSAYWDRNGFCCGRYASRSNAFLVYMLQEMVVVTIGGSRGGVRDARPPLGVQILSISCSFRENLACSRPPWRVHAPPRENPGSATGN